MPGKRGEDPTPWKCGKGFYVGKACRGFYPMEVWKGFYVGKAWRMELLDLQRRWDEPF